MNQLVPIVAARLPELVAVAGERAGMRFIFASDEPRRLRFRGNGLAAAHGAGTLLGNPEEEARLTVASDRRRVEATAVRVGGTRSVRGLGLSSFRG